VVPRARSTFDAAGLEVLEADECRRLLEAGGVGRVALPGDPPIIRPVNYAFEGNRVVIRTGTGALWQAASAEALATFEIDGVRTVDHRGWSVIVSGPLGCVEADERTRALPLRAWAPTGRDRFVALTVVELSGRRLGARW
jgi:nitroimidazol reductase NimA-like FMN-containing flavoprotein (pyridoxamine 5'-phosphate oxidase superfamily)